jgi:hypothetical protein
MSYVRSLVSLVFGPLLLASGCASPVAFVTSEGGEDDFGEQGTPVRGSPTGDHRIILNGLPTSLFVTHRAALVDLAGGAFTPNAAAKSPLIQSDEGRLLLSYVMKCALGGGDALTVQHQGTSFVFDGGVGLAVNWKAGALSAPEKRWVSACLLAHSNAFGHKVPISLRGNHPALATTADEEAQYPVEEGAFYGDLFAAQAGAAPMFACSGLGLSDPCELASNEWLDERVCAQAAGEVSECGFYVPGDCYNFAAAAPGACATVDGDGYGACSDGAGAPVYEEIITVYLQHGAASSCGSGG